ncbi:MAG: bifunctional glutamate N-acetyltransferase/amino-acid acetyltransferase ArgJ [Chloroflexi bacterium]|nr:bifunctional glutamate N-acetyltransferase/amino-acid acetyltransferase ArgJ [Chloroflexota bacterium]MCH8103259.1 bifunctional glutamate N-acetyltransferase/amino-acid acetyltransferase ArgJ [Chloroflexota bacterium]
MTPQLTPPLTEVKNGTVTSPAGFRAGAVYSGLKTPGPDKLDLGILVSDSPCDAAATFSQNSILSPSVTLSREAIQGGGKFRAVVVNSGNANCSVGEHGIIDAREVISLAASQAGVRPEEVLICSTGVIGVELPMGLLRAHMTEIELVDDGGMDLAKAIITTDTRLKTRAVSFEVGGKTVTVGGIAKGSGMIHPNMATMLAFLTTDAAVDSGLLKQVLSDAVDVSFNLVDIDTDQSTNDTCILLANGAAGNSPIEAGSDAADTFAAAVRDVAIHLAREMARDGEGATKLIDATVTGAHSVDDARLAARSIVSSPLVKTAVYGRDPNWGRILMALGKTEIPLDESKIQVFINDIQIVESGAAIPFHAESVVQALGQPEVYLRVALNVGDGDATAWGCDLTEEYVVFNSAYTT